MSQDMESFESGKSHNIKQFHTVKEGYGCKIKMKRNVKEDQTLVAFERMCDVVPDIRCTNGEGKEEKSKNIKDKTHPEDDVDKGNTDIVDIYLKEIKQRIAKQEAEAMYASKFYNIEEKDGDFYLIACNSKNNSRLLDKEEQDTVFVLELEETQFGAQMFRGDGEMSISEFFKDYEHYMAMRSISFENRQMGLCIRNFLAERARDIYDEIAEKDNYDEVKEVLLNKFQTQRLREKAELKIKNLFQEENESVLKFANRLTKIVRLATEGKSEVEFQEKMKYEFCKRVSPNYSYLIKGHNPNTFEEAFEKAEIYEHEFAIKEGRGGDTTHVVEYGESNVSNNRQKLGKQRKKQYRQRRVCYRCRKPGHQIKDCLIMQRWH